MDAKIKHLEMIQGVISRMAQNSFLLKGWSVGLISALFALAASGGKAGFALLAFVPLIMFWLLDGYFLWQERLFRDLYDHVRKSGDGDWANELLFSMDVRLSGSERTWLGAVISTTLLPFHGVMLAIVFIVTVALAV